MKTSLTATRPGAFTLVEMLCVIAIITLLAALLLPAIAQGRARGQRIHCVNNLKQTGIAFHVFTHDHNGRSPPLLRLPTRSFAPPGLRDLGAR
jgi:prepilin-type N-terminal cleavage/methylation domain-containing protein